MKFEVQNKNFRIYLIMRIIFFSGLKFDLNVKIYLKALKINFKIDTWSFERNLKITKVKYYDRKIKTTLSQTAIKILLYIFILHSCQASSKCKKKFIRRVKSLSYVKICKMKFHFFNNPVYKRNKFSSHPHIVYFYCLYKNTVVANKRKKEKKNIQI